MSRKITKKVAAVILILVSLMVLSPAVVLFWWIEPVILQKAETLKREQNDPIYTFDYDNIDLNIWNLHVCVEGFSLLLKDSASILMDQYDLQIASNINTNACISGFGIFNFLVHGNISIENITLENTSIELFVADGSDTTQYAEIESNEPAIPIVSIEHLAIVNTSVAIKNELGIDQLILDSLDITINEIAYDQSNDETTIFPGLIFGHSIVQSGPFGIRLKPELILYFERAKIINNYNELSEEYDLSLLINKYEIINESKTTEIIKNATGEQLIFTDWEYNKFLADSSLFFRKLHINGLNLELAFSNPNAHKKTKRSDPSYIIKTQLPKLSFDTLLLSKLDVKINNLSNGQNYSIQNIDALLQTVKKSDSTEHLPLGLSFKKIEFQTSKVALDLNSFYKANLASLEVKNDQVGITNFHFSPKFDKNTFTEKLDFENDRFEVQAKRLDLKGFEIVKMLGNKHLEIDKVNVMGLDLEVYRDKYKQDPQYIEKLLPVSLIRGLKIPIHVKNINVLEANIAYEQLGDLVKTDTLARLEFNDSHIMLKNITNMERLIARESIMTMDFTTKLMKHGSATGEIKFFLDDDNDYFEATVLMDSFPAFYINPFINNLMLIKIRSGDIYSTAFSVTADRDEMNGVLEMEYENILLDVMRVDDPSVKSGFWNMVANSAVKKTNLRSRKNYKKGVIFYQRNKEKFIFNYLWNGLKSGMADIMIPFVNNEKKKKKIKKTKVNQRKKITR